MKSRHMELLRDLSARKREQEEQRRKEELRLKRREVLLRERLFGGSSIFRRAGSCSVDSESSPLAPAPVPAPMHSEKNPGSCPGQGDDVEARRQWRAKCNQDIECRQDEAINKVMKLQQLMHVKQQREILKKHWRISNARRYLLDRCTDPELKGFLESKAQQLPKADISFSRGSRSWHREAGSVPKDTGTSQKGALSSQREAGRSSPQQPGCSSPKEADCSPRRHADGSSQKRADGSPKTDTDGPSLKEAGSGSRKDAGSSSRKTVGSSSLKDLGVSSQKEAGGIAQRESGSISPTRASSSMRNSWRGSPSPRRGDKASTGEAQRASSLMRSSRRGSSSPRREKTSTSEVRGMDAFLGRLRLTRMRTTCSTLSEWKHRNGCRPDQKVFVCQGGYPDFRDALLRRGWFLNEDKDSRHFDLKWCMASSVDHDHLLPQQIVNHFDRSRDLTTKVGLTINLRQSIWHSGVDTDFFYPRAFDLYDPLDRAEFALNFKHSKAESILRGFLADVDSGAEVTFSSDVVSVASKICLRLITDVDEVLDCGRMAEELGSVPAADWALLKQVNLDSVTERLEGGLKDDALDSLINKRGPAKISLIEKRKSAEEAREAEKKQAKELAEKKPSKEPSSSSAKKTKKKKEPAILSEALSRFGTVRGKHLIARAREIVREMSDKNRQHAINGRRNAWMIKPSGKSRGRGIQVMRELDEIFKKTESDGFQWICQKYIEQPQLVHGYKFDIRQWVLVTDWNPLSIYIWRQPYLRFAGQKYDQTISDRSEFVHLTNNSIIHSMDGFAEKNADLQTSGYMWFKQQYQEYLHAKLCTCKSHYTPWLEDPPYTCEYYGVKWEDVMFVAQEEDEDDDEPTANATNAGGRSRQVSSRLSSPSPATSGNASPAAASSSCYHSAPSSRRGSPEEIIGGDSSSDEDGDTTKWCRDSPTVKEERASSPPPASGDRKPCEDIWETQIRPQIDKIVLWSLMCVTDEIKHRKNTCELYGYDFMISEGPDGPKVWLIEVNSSPACDYSTPVTCPLVKKLMEDTAKVIVDCRENPKADTGEWEQLQHSFTKSVSQRTQNCPVLVVAGKEVPPPKRPEKKKKKKKKKHVSGGSTDGGGRADRDDESDTDGRRNAVEAGREEN